MIICRYTVRLRLQEMEIVNKKYQSDADIPMNRNCTIILFMKCHGS